MNYLEIVTRINDIKNIINGLEQNSFEVSNKPFGNKEVDINYLFLFINIDKEKTIKRLKKELKKLNNLLDEK